MDCLLDIMEDGGAGPHCYLESECTVCARVDEMNAYERRGYVPVYETSRRFTLLCGSLWNCVLRISLRTNALQSTHS